MPGGVDAIDDRVDPELFDVDPAFLIDLRIAMKAGGDPRAECIAGAGGLPRAGRSRTGRTACRR